MQITNLTSIKTPPGYEVTVANKRIYVAGGDDLESGPIPLNVYDMNTNLKIPIDSSRKCSICIGWPGS